MVYIQPAAERFRITDNAEGYRLVIPAARNLFMILFLIFWLGGWAAGEITVIGELLTGKIKGNSPLFTLFWLGGWTVGGGFAFSFVIWMIAGSDVILLPRSEPRLVRMSKISGLTLRTQEFDITSIRNMRISQQYSRRNAMPGSSIAFDYGAKTYRFGWGMDEAEANIIVKELRKRSPLLLAQSTDV